MKRPPRPSLAIGGAKSNPYTEGSSDAFFPIRGGRSTEIERDRQAAGPRAGSNRESRPGREGGPCAAETRILGPPHPPEPARLDQLREVAEEIEEEPHRRRVGGRAMGDRRHPLDARSVSAGRAGD